MRWSWDKHSTSDRPLEAASATKTMEKSTDVDMAGLPIFVSIFLITLHCVHHRKNSNHGNRKHD